MEKVFEKIIEKLEAKKYKNPVYDYEDRKNETLDVAIGIVKQEAEQYNGDRNAYKADEIDVIGNEIDNPDLLMEDERYI